MNGAQVHLAINHSPLILTICGILILIVALIRKHQFLFRVGTVFLIGAVVIGVPTYLSGGDAAGVIRNLPGIERPYIREHAEAAQWVLYSAIFLGIVALIAFFATRKSIEFSRGYAIALLVIGLFAATVIARTSHLGGQIRHQELRSDGVPEVAPDSLHR